MHRKCGRLGLTDLSQLKRATALLEAVCSHVISTSSICSSRHKSTSQTLTLKLSEKPSVRGAWKAARRRVTTGSPSSVILPCHSSAVLRSASGGEVAPAVLGGVAAGVRARTQPPARSRQEMIDFAHLPRQRQHLCRMKRYCDAAEVLSSVCQKSCPIPPHPCGWVSRGR